MTEPHFDDPERAQANRRRYVEAMHALQTGVKIKMQRDPKDTEPVSLRVGVNSAMVETATLQRLLVEKGIITWDEWWEALAQHAETERRLYEDELTALYGASITLG